MARQVAYFSLRWISCGAVATTVSLFVLGGGGCFTGAEAVGLPCNADLDCGVDDRCIDGFCGGPPATTTVDPTTESSSSTTDMTPTTGDSLCDGELGAQCEPAMMGTPDADCDADCTFPTCGDGTHNPHAQNDAFNPPVGNEECDDGVQGMRIDTAQCDADCTQVACGDGHENLLGESCDDGNEDEYDACTKDCQIPAIAERFEAEVWTSEPYDLSDYAGTPWSDTTGAITTGWTWADSQWNSGPPPYRQGEIEETFQYNYASTTRLVSPAFDLPATVPDGFVLQLRFWHSLTVESPGCNQDEENDGDGGVVQLRVGGDDVTLLPDGGYMTLQDDCSGVAGGGVQPNPNPLRVEGGQAFTGASQTGEVVVDLSAHLGAKSVQIVFEFGTDCVHCIDKNLEPSLWTIDDVVVAAFPIE
jgi:hypothetical protein